MAKKLQSFSLVLAVYNGEETIKEALESILNIDYPKDNFELILVNDGSTDDTLSAINGFHKKHSTRINMHILESPSNEGRIKARIKGAEKARFERIMILDHQAEMQENTLMVASKYDSKLNIISNYYMEKERSVDDRVFYLLRKKYYAPYWGKDFEKVEVTKNNFNKISKGTGGFITNKSSFLKYSNKLNKGKFENEDTKLFRLYIDNGEKLIRVPDIKLLYKNRVGGLTSLKHIFKRGPRFVDYYFRKPLVLTLGFFFPISLIAVIISIAYVFPIFLGGVLLILVAINTILSIYLSEEIKDFFYLLYYLPGIILFFYAGILNGVRIHFLSFKSK